MLARSSIARGSSQLLKCCAKAAPPSRRTMAAAAGSNPFHFNVGEASSIKVASRDDGGPTTSLAVVVRGGSRYEPAPGLAHGLEKFAFKNTTKRSSLRVQREAELLGGSFGSSMSRENIVLRAKFLRGDLPYFLEALGDVLTKTKFTHYEFDEEVAMTMGYEIDALHKDPAALALEAAHSVAFHRGLGAPRLALTTKYITDRSITGYARQVYTKSNIALVASGTPQSEIEKWTAQFFNDVPAGSVPSAVPSKYFGGESRTFSPLGNAFVIAFPGSAGPSSMKAEYAVLSYILGGETSIKWNSGSTVLSKAVADLPGVSAVSHHLAYSDNGLIYITVTGPSGHLTKAGEAVVKAIDGVAKITEEEVKKAIAKAKFSVLATAEDRSVGLEFIGQGVLSDGKAPQVEDTIKALEKVTIATVKEAAKKILGGKASYAAVGDLHVLPFAQEIGLNV